MADFSGYMIASDIDGTILPSGGSISRRNTDAIKYFTENGGIFTLATGRSVSAARHIALGLGILVPMVVDNGAMLYDAAADKILGCVNIPSAAVDIAAALIRRFPGCGAETYREREIFLVAENERTISHLMHIDRAEPENCRIPFEDCPTPWQKVLFVAESDICAQMKEYADSLPHDGINIVRSGEHYVELIPTDGTKGKGVLRLAEMLGIPRDGIMTAGDYTNDCELISVGAKSFAPSNAHDEIKRLADFTVGDCSDGVIADIVGYIEKTNKNK